MNAREALRLLSPLTESQRGMVTTAQAQQHGVTRLLLTRLEKAGDLERVLRGVYRKIGSAALDHDSLYAHWLALDAGRTASERLLDQNSVIAVSHRSAASLYGIGDLPARTHTFTSNRRKQTERASGRVVQDIKFARVDARVQSGMLVTSPDRTVYDLLRSEGDRSQVARAVSDAVRQGFTNPGSLVQAMSAWSGRHMGVDIEELLTLAGMGPGSPWRTIDTNGMESPPVAALLPLPRVES